ncbi:MAG: tandem-95 repeat protein [Xanthomonadales bacterium]|nr:tandem-95 repeat protein [Xanthomonadales bacterium]
MKIRMGVSALAMGAWLVCGLAVAQDDDEGRQSDSGSYSYIGDDVRIGLGYNSDTKLTGEFFWTFDEQVDSAWVAEGWLGDESAGGIKLNYHWLSGGVEAGTDADGNPIYSDGRVRKLFLAADRNVYDDGKISFGGGSERNNRFWSLYGSLATTGERFIGQSIMMQDRLVTGVIDNHAFSRLDVLETITDFYAHPYDWGIGFRVGRYFEDELVRLRGGLDYEEGDYDASQLTAFASLDKRFENSAHGFSLRAEYLHKNGDFEIDRNDMRVTALWTWAFGESFRPSHVYREVEAQRIPDPSELPTEEITEVVQNRVTLDNSASFELDSAALNADAEQALRDVLRSLEQTRVVGDILVVGHTCSLGTDEYNQALSERRAITVFDFLKANGVPADQMRWEGHGEHEPRYSNETEETRKRNRRVEISFIAEQEVVREVVVGEGQPVTEWVQEKVPAEAAWIRRALRNPVVHKRAVDFYRINRVTENLIPGEVEFENTGPSAVDDQYTVEQNSTDNAFDVLVNDSDPEEDTLVVVSVTTPANGSASFTAGGVTYTPDTDFYGVDQFSYTIEDGYGGSATAQVTVNVQRPNDPPVAVDDQYEVTQDSSGNLLDVLVNDSDPEDDAIELVSVTTPQHGTASLSGDQVSYTPNPGYTGTDSFSYTIRDALGAEATAQVDITIRAPNQPPIAVDDFAQTRKNTAKVIAVLANDSDPDGDPLTIVEIIQGENKMGFVEINADGTVTYTPMAGWWGGDSFQYVISDGRGGTAVATVTMNVIKGFISQ